MIFNAAGDHKFNWGDTLMIRRDAPLCLCPGEIVSVCSVIKIDPDDVIKDPSLVEATWLYTVEFGDGSSIELSECYLEPYPKESLGESDDSEY